MPPWLRSALQGGALFGAIAVIVSSAAALGAARDHRRHRAPCPFDEDEPSAPLATVARILVEAVLTWLFVVATPLVLIPRPRRRFEPGDRPPVVFVHGWAGTPAGFLLLRRRLTRDGWLHLHHAWLPPFFVSPARCGRRLARTIERVRARTGAPSVDVVAHSMGGLVARAMLGDEPGAAVRRLLTLGTPHQGTRAVGVGTLDPALATLRVDSPLIRAVASAGTPPLVECAAIYSVDDALIRPPGHGYWAGALNVEVQGPGHKGLLVSQRVYEVVRETLAPESAWTTAGQAYRGTPVVE